MKDDFLLDIEYQGITARLKRLSDSMFYSIRELYAERKLEIEPNWHLIFMLLKENKVNTVSEIAKVMKLSQPATIKMVEKMKQKGFIDIVTDNRDRRRKLLQLSEKALNDLPEFEKVWLAGKKAMIEMLAANQDFLSSLKKFEEQNKQMSFKKRMLEFL